MKDNKNKNKKDNTFLYFIIGLIALFVWVEFDKQQSYTHDQAKTAQELENAYWYYNNFMQY